MLLPLTFMNSMQQLIGTACVSLFVFQFGIDSIQNDIFFLLKSNLAKLISSHIIFLITIDFNGNAHDYIETNDFLVTTRHRHDEPVIIFNRRNRIYEICSWNCLKMPFFLICSTINNNNIMFMFILGILYTFAQMCAYV